MAMKELALYVAEQLSSLNEIRYIPMMGGWLFYYRGKIIGGIYGDGFAVKDTEASRRYMPDCGKRFGQIRLTHCFPVPF